MNYRKLYFFFFLSLTVYFRVVVIVQIKAFHPIYNEKKPLNLEMDK